MRALVGVLSVLGTLAAPQVIGQARTGVPLAGLESDPSDTVQAEDCAVNLVAGHVSLELSVSTSEESPALLLEGPFFGWSGSPAVYPEQQFPELTIRADDPPSAPQDRFEAFMGGRNITQMVAMAGMDAWAITRTPPLTSAQAGSPQMLKALSNMGAIEKSGEQYLAKWQARRIIRIPLAAVARQHLRLDYTARPATAMLTMAQLDTTARERRYCLSRQSLRRQMHTAGTSAALAVTEYTIPVGIDAKPPRSVTLSMSSGVAANSPARVYLLVCGPHDKPIAKRNTLTREHVDVDDTGNLHILGVTEPAGVGTTSKPPTN